MEINDECQVTGARRRAAYTDHTPPMVAIARELKRIRELLELQMRNEGQLP